MGLIMRIQKIKINNYRCFDGEFVLELNSGINILVGNNEAGKSTILEAIHLALSGLINGRYLRNELSQYFFNTATVARYLESLQTATHLPPPTISIELFFEGGPNPALAMLEGNGNSDSVKGCGVWYVIEFDEKYQAEYETLIKTAAAAGEPINSIPIEYYTVTWKHFGREGITARTIPIKSALIDSSSARIQSGSDIYISRIIRDNLDEKERVEISQAHRQLKEAFMDKPSVKAINTKINKSASITNKEVRISVDLTTQNAWEAHLITYLNDVPFHHVGKGEQSIVKTNLAMSHKKALEANVILLEEPENHLSHVRLNELIKKISEGIGEKQLIISTHSSFVVNKLGLDWLIFLHDAKTTKLNALSKDTEAFFKKLSGYDTLRLILCNKAILVEGDSDELVVQKAYKDKHGKLPIEDGVDVISVGTSFLRFLEIADKVNKPVAIVTDNDGDVAAATKKYDDYLGANAKKNITICFDATVDTGTLKIGAKAKEFNYNTLEPKLLKANNLKTLNMILGTEFKTDDELHIHMKANKTECALKIFESNEPIKFPQYILDAI